MAKYSNKIRLIIERYFPTLNSFLVGEMSIFFPANAWFLKGTKPEVQGLRTYNSKLHKTLDKSVNIIDI